jgi:hypothetical protein
MVEIDGKTVVFSTNFLIKNDQEAIIQATLPGDTLRLSVMFQSGIPSSDRSGSWTQENGMVKFVFSGFSNPLGTCLLEPTKFGDIGGKRLFFQLAHHYVGESNLAHLYILVGA